ncbi:hypothetical protein XENOCAPTIV_002929 [Xenoophorus captivus]|uniref:Uncharacterized protein n=1 Tax=Xenoophorus captivus TaxID=1517983 RepID=A0ABV0Q7P1_9TELE
MADVHVHFIGHTQGEIHSLLLVGLCAHNHAVLKLSGQAELCTPLRNLKEDIQQKKCSCCIKHCRVFSIISTSFSKVKACFEDYIKSFCVSKTNSDRRDLMVLFLIMQNCFGSMWRLQWIGA